MDDHERHRRSRPSADGLVRFAAAIGAAGDAVVVRRLGGGLAAATHLIRLGDGRRVVLKRYAADSATPALEWETLTYATAAGLPAPEPVAVDQEGSWFGTPAIAMSVVAGRPDLAPANAARYVDEVAHAMARVHCVDIGNPTGALARTPSVDGWSAPDEVPPGLLARATIVRVIAALERVAASLPRDALVLTHSDFHPGNVLWSRGRLTGVIDWGHARAGPRWWELAYFRMELAVLLDLDAADALVARYESIIGQRSGAQPLWDLFPLYAGHRWGHLWLQGYREQGSDLTLDELRRRLNANARTVLRRVDTVLA